MGRQPRRLVDNGIYHALNRGNCRMDIFHKPGDLESFLKLIEAKRHGLESTPRNPWRPSKRPSNRE